jgi:PAS domain S-box-containing protein
MGTAADATRTRAGAPPDVDPRDWEARYRAVFEATDDALDIADLEGRFVEVNPAFCRLYGYSRDELIGQHVDLIVHPDDRHVIAPGLREVAAGGTGWVRGRGVRKDGSTFLAESHGTTIVAGGATHILGMTRDITEQVSAYETLEQRVDERTRELSTLLDVSSHVASTLELRPLLGLILDELKAVIDHSGSSIYVVEGEWLHMLEHRFPPGNAPLDEWARTPLDGALWWPTVHRGEPFVIDDVHADAPDAAAYRALFAERWAEIRPYCRSYIAVPLTVKGCAIGALIMSHAEPGYFAPHRRAVALALANQAAVAIENARLYGRARDAAILEERQRLSRELHDSVSQALYSIALGARTARDLLDREPARAAEPLDFALTQAEAALAEMRALIFELRPEALEQDGLVAALQRQADLIRARRIAVDTALCAEPDVSLAAKETLYRVAQEALHNAAKHAGANVVRVSLVHEGRELVLRIEDDGRGFDPGVAYPGHLGLRSMRERAEHAGGTLSLESVPGLGAVVRVALPLRRDG